MSEFDELYRRWRAAGERVREAEAAMRQTHLEMLLEEHALEQTEQQLPEEFRHLSDEALANCIALLKDCKREA